MKIGVDIDGVLTTKKNIRFFNSLSEDNEIHVITARADSDIYNTIDEVTEWGVQFNSLHFFVSSQHGPLEKVEVKDSIYLWYLPFSLFEAKAYIARELQLDQMYDDMPEFLKPMSGIECFLVKGRKMIPFVSHDE